MRILREPLLHFLLLGAALFVLSMFVGKPDASASAPADKQIVVTHEKIALLKNGYVLDNGRDPTDEELQRLIDAFVREEVLVREARAQGLDRDDSIVRRRLVQKMEFAVAEPPAPAQSVLENYLAQYPAAFRTPDGKVPALADIHSAVLAAWMNQQRSQEIQEMYQKYRAEYQVTIDTPATKKAAGAGT